MSDTNTTPLLEAQNRGAIRRGWKLLERIVDVDEAKGQLLFALPMVLTNMSYYAITLVSVMFVGHLGDTELAGATLGNSWSFVTGLALLTGLTGSLETLCGQGYGAKLYRMLGIYLQSSFIISTIFSIAVSVLWFFSEEILILLHQQPDVFRVAGLYLKCLIPGMFAYGYLQCILRILQTQTVVMPLVVCSLVPLLLHVLITYLLVHVCGMGFVGTSVSGSVSLWISCLILAGYVKRSKNFKHTWGGFTMEAFEHVLPSMKLAIPSAVMVCFQSCAFEILVLLAGLMPDSELSTSLIAICTRVSNEISAGNIEQAKNAVSVTLKLSVLLAATFILLLAFCHNQWVNLFSSSRDITTAFAYMAPFLAGSILFDSAQAVLSGVARGCGWQHLAAWTNLVAFYLIVMPLALLFAFRLQFYAQGLWMGLICGLACQATTLLIITLHIKWTKINLTVEDKRHEHPNSSV